jgi:hypothetical protein
VWTAAAVVAGIVALVSAGLCFVALRKFQQMFRQEQRLLQEQMALLDDAVRMIGTQVAEIQPPFTTAVSDAPAAEEAEGESIDPAIAPEIQATIAAAAVVAAGQSVRLRSARLVKARESASAWSQQGRVLVQSSHNVRAPR